jgi:hypothetical protein
LAAAHDRVQDSCRRGAWAGFGRASGAAAGDELPAYDDDDAWLGRTIDGAWLAELLTGDGDGDGRELHRRGVLVRGARILDGLDLERAELTRQLVLVGCQLGPHPVELGGARARLVDLSGVSCGGVRAADVELGGSLLLGRGFRATGPVTLFRAAIDGDLVGDAGRFHGAEGRAPVDSRAALGAKGARVSGNVLLRDAVVEGAVRLPGITVGGGLECDGTRITAPGTTALLLDQADIGGSVVLTRGFTATGRVRLRDVKIGGNLDCRDAHLDGGGAGADGGDALDADRSEVAGSLFLHEGFAATGAVRLVSVRAGGDVSLSGATLSHPGHTALSAARMQVAGSLLMLRDFSAEGRVRLAGASFGADVHCAGGRFAHTDGPAIDGAGLQVVGGLRLIDGTTIEGGLQLRGASVGGDLDLRAARLTRPDGIALDARNLRVTGNVLLKDGLEVRGTVLMIGATVGANVECTGGVLRGGPARSALNLGGSHIEGSVYLNNGFRAESQVRMLGTVLGGALMCAGGRIDNPGGVGLIADNLRCAGTVYLTDGFTSVGEVQLSAATIGGNLECRGARLDSPGGTALAADGAHVAGTVALDGGTTIEGRVLLADATAAALRDDRSSWPEELDLDGFRYGRLDCPRSARGWRVRAEWLRRQPRPGAAAYLQLAAVYQAAGDELDARKIRIERHNVLLDPPERWRDQLPGGPRGALEKLWRRLLRITIGHGFEPARALLIALPLLVAMALWYGHARHHDMLVATSEGPVPAGAPQASVCTGDYPCVQPVVYALDNLVPIVDFGQRSSWATDQAHRGARWWDDGRWLAAATWVTSAVGWILATLAAASFTQVIRRD